MGRISIRMNLLPQTVYLSLLQSEKARFDKFVEEILKEPAQLEQFLLSRRLTSNTRIVHANCEEEVFIADFRGIFFQHIQQIQFSFPRGNRTKINIEEILVQPSTNFLLID